MQLKHDRRQITLASAVLLSFLLLLLPATGGEREGKGAERLLERRLQKFEVHEASVLDSLILLGQQERIPMGIEFVSNSMITEKVSITVEGRTLDETLRAILRDTPKVRWTEEQGIILVEPIHALKGEKRNLFDTVVPSFRIDRATLQEMSNLLEMDLQLQLNPEIHGFAGNFPVAATESIGPFSLTNATVRAILNEGVRRHRGAAWIARVPPDRLDRLTEDGLWAIVFYQQPPKHISELCCYSSQM